MTIMKPGPKTESQLTWEHTSHIGPDSSKKPLPAALTMEKSDNLTLTATLVALTKNRN